MNEVKYIDVSELKRCPIQLRPVIKNSLEYETVRDAIRNHGVLQSVLVRQDNEIVDGCHRFEACLDLRITRIPCIIRFLTDQEVNHVQLICNASRVETMPVQYARRLRQILKVERSMTLNELAHSISQHPDWVKRMLQIVYLSEKAKTYLTKGKIDVTLAADLSRLSLSQQDSVLELLGAHSPNEFRDLVRKEARHLRQGKKHARSVSNLQRDYRLRNVKEIQYEIENPTVAASVLSAAKATTPLECFQAGLKWASKNDEASLALQVEKSEAEEAALLKKRISEQP